MYESFGNEEIYFTCTVARSDGTGSGGIGDRGNVKPLREPEGLGVTDAVAPTDGIGWGNSYLTKSNFKPKL